ncbi:LytR/AlgR family response regulator transcription factor [Runella sp.]|uniref:LytR/AlgR family response regulator transcription factor n=1 Tax=Runella sp. TaxID=1960881 RepID=UPI003D0DD1C7
MTQLRCIAIDDEPFALELLADDIQKVSFLELFNTFTNPLDARTFLEANPVDLVFLDIQMPTLTGTQFLRSLPKPPMVIFTTAYQQYALEGFELNVVDYLLKPIPFERFLTACEKALDLFVLRKKETGLPTERGFFFVFAEYKEIKLFFDEILYVEGMKDYVKIFTNQQTKPILTRLNLKAMEAKLPPNLFCRVHQSFIVALDKITSSQKTKLQIGNREIRIGSRFLAHFEEKYRSTH